MTINHREYVSKIIHHVDFASSELYDAENSIDQKDETLIYYKRFFNILASMLDHIIEEIKNDTGWNM